MPEENRATATIAYTGEALAGGLMDVRDLAPALLAVGQMCQAANRTLNGGDAEISTYVRSDMKGGSFEVSIEVVQFAHKAVTLLATHRDSLSDAKALLEVLGLSGATVTGASVGLIKFVRWLRNRKPEKTEEKAGSVQVQIGRDHIEVSRSVFIIAQDQEARSALEEMVRPLNRKGIDGFEVRAGTHHETVASSAEVDVFTAPRQEDVVPENLLSETEHIAVLEVVRPHFEAGHRWGFFDGSRQFGVAMKDEKFLGQVQRHEITFGKGDALRLKLRTRVWRDESGALKSESIATEILDVLPAPKQLLLVPKSGAEHS